MIDVGGHRGARSASCRSGRSPSSSDRQSGRNGYVRGQRHTSGRLAIGQGRVPHRRRDHAPRRHILDPARYDSMAGDLDVRSSLMINGRLGHDGEPVLAKSGNGSSRLGRRPRWSRRSTRPSSSTTASRPRRRQLKGFEQQFHSRGKERPPAARHHVCPCRDLGSSLLASPGSCGPAAPRHHLGSHGATSARQRSAAHTAARFRDRVGRRCDGRAKVAKVWVVEDDPRESRPCWPWDFAPRALKSRRSPRAPTRWSASTEGASNFSCSSRVARH